MGPIVQLSRRRALVTLGAILGGLAETACSSAATPAGKSTTQPTGSSPTVAGTPSGTSKALDSLIADARKEGGLSAQILDTSLPEAGKIADAFSKRFGLSNVSTGGETE